MNTWLGLTTSAENQLIAAQSEASHAADAGHLELRTREAEGDVVAGAVIGRHLHGSAGDDVGLDAVVGEEKLATEDKEEAMARRR